jgi:hypothetical protein
MQAFPVLWRAMKAVWEDLLLLVLMNLLAVFGTLFIIPAPGLWAGLHVVCNRCVTGYSISWDIFFKAFRSFYRLFLPMCLFSIVVSVLIAINFVFYANQLAGESWGAWVQGAWLAVGFMWLAVQFYVYAFYIEQEDRRWRTAFRNAGLIAGANPLFTLFLLLITTMLLVVVTVFMPPVFALIGMVFWVMVSTSAVVNRVEVYRKRMGLPPRDKIEPD